MCTSVPHDQNVANGHTFSLSLYYLFIVKPTRFIHFRLSIKIVLINIVFLHYSNMNILCNVKLFHHVQDTWF